MRYRFSSSEDSRAQYVCVSCAANEFGVSARVAYTQFGVGCMKVIVPPRELLFDGNLYVVHINNPTECAILSLTCMPSVTPSGTIKNTSWLPARLTVGAPAVPPAPPALHRPAPHRSGHPHVCPRQTRGARTCRAPPRSSAGSGLARWSVCAGGGHSWVVGEIW